MLLGNLELIEVIGRGGMGVVWRARDLTLQRTVAVKMLSGGEFASPDMRERFQLEARATARLQHESIVPVYSVGSRDDLSFIVMELIEGETLQEAATREGRTPRDVAAWMKSVAEAVQHAHERGVLHRDLKPSNILIDREERPRVTDFGLAKLVPLNGGEADPSLSGRVAGSPAYMAPEQTRGEAVSAATDVYGLGATLYHALVGRPPFQGDSLLGVMAQVEREQPLPPRRLNPDIHVDLQTICLKCLEKNPQSRYTTPGELAGDLERFLDGRPVEARPIGTIGTLIRMARRHPWVATAVLLMFLLITTIIFSFFSQARMEREHNETLGHEQARTRLALANARLGEARSRIRIGGADSRREAMSLLGLVLGEPVLSPELRAEARDAVLSAKALDELELLPLGGEHARSDDYTMAASAADHSFWIRGDYPNLITLLGNDGRLIRRFDTGGKKVSMVLGLSPSGRYVALRHGEELGIWDVGEGVQTRQVRQIHLWPAGTPFSMGSFVFLAGDRGLVWGDSRAGELVVEHFDSMEEARLRVPLPNRNEDRLSIGAIALSADEKRVVVAHEDHPRVDLLEWPSGSLLETFSDSGSAGFTSVALAEPGGFVGAGMEDGRILVWKIDSASSEPRRFKGHAQSVTWMDFSADGQRLLSTGMDATFSLWNASSGKPAFTLRVESTRPHFDLEGKVGLVLHDGVFKHLQPGYSELVRTVHPDTPPGIGQVAALDPEGGRLALANRDGVQVMDLARGTVEYQIPATSVLGLRWLEDGTSLLLSDIEGIRRWQASNTATLLVGASSRWFGLKGASGRGWAVAVDRKQEVVVLEPRTGRLVKRVPFDQPGDAVLSPDGSLLLVCASYEGVAGLFSTSDGSLIRELKIPSRRLLEWSPDGKWVCAHGESVLLWRTEDWSEVLLEPLRPNRFPNGGCAFIGPSSLAVVEANHLVALVDLDTGIVMGRLEAPGEEPLTQVSVSLDGTRLAASCASGVVQVWNMEEVSGILGEVAQQQGPRAAAMFP